MKTYTNRIVLMIAMLVAVLLPMAHAATTRYVDADGFKNPARTKTYDLPTISGSSDTLTSSTNTATLTNKTLTSPIISTISNTGTITLPSSTTTLVGRDTTDTLTNKTLTSPTINTPTMDIPLFDGQASTPATPSAGFYKLYFKDSDGKPYYLNPTGTEVQVGSGAGGGSINHLSNSDAETDTTGQSLYADAAATSPVDGTGGSSSLTLSRTTTAGEVLRGVGSFEIAKGAANEQGEGVGIDFTVALGDYNPPKVQTIEFEYKASANFDYGSGTAADPSDIVVYVYARDTGALIQPSTFTLDGGGKFVAQFQPLTTDDDYRLILHVATTNASAWDFWYDSIKVGSQNTARGPPISDWQSSGNGVTASIRGSSNESVYTNSTLASFKWRRVGDHMEVSAIIQFSGAPATGTGGIALAMDGVTLDSNKISGGIRNGSAAFFDSSASNWYSAVPRILAGTSRILVTSSITDGAGYASGDVSPTVPVTIANADELHLRFSVPITGWASNVSIGQMDDGRAVALRATLSTAQTSVADKVIPFNSATVDTHGKMNTSTGVWTAPVSGLYAVYARSLYSVLDGATNATIQIRKNSSAINQSYCSVLTAGATSSGMCHIFEIVSLVAGDTIDIFADGDASFDIDSSSSRTAVSIDRIGASTTIAASETVSARYTTAAAQLIEGAGVAEVVDFGTKDHDSHSMCTTGASFKCTAPIGGTYTIQASTYFNSNAGFAAGESYIMYVRKNGTDYAQLYAHFAESTTTRRVQLLGTTTIKLLAGEYIDITVINNTGTDTALQNSALSNFLSFSKVGNF